MPYVLKYSRNTFDIRKLRIMLFRQSLILHRPKTETANEDIIPLKLIIQLWWYKKINMKKNTITDTTVQWLYTEYDKK